MAPLALPLLRKDAEISLCSRSNAVFRSGIICGCVAGLTQFFCLCQGLLTIYFGSNSSEKTKSTKRGCAKCAEGKEVVEPVQITIDRT